MGVVKKYAYDGVFRCFDMCDIIENYKHDELCEEKLFISLAALKDMVDSSIRDKYDDDNDDTVVRMEESKIISKNYKAVRRFFYDKKDGKEYSLYQTIFDALGIDLRLKDDDSPEEKLDKLKLLKLICTAERIGVYESVKYDVYRFPEIKPGKVPIIKILENPNIDVIDGGGYHIDFNEEFYIIYDNVRHQVKNADEIETKIESIHHMWNGLINSVKNEAAVFKSVSVQADAIHNFIENEELKNIAESIPNCKAEEQIKKTGVMEQFFIKLATAKYRAELNGNTKAYTDKINYISENFSSDFIDNYICDSFYSERKSFEEFWNMVFGEDNVEKSKVWQLIMLDENPAETDDLLKKKNDKKFKNRCLELAKLWKTTTSNKLKLNVDEWCIVLGALIEILNRTDEFETYDNSGFKKYRSFSSAIKSLDNDKNRTTHAESALRIYLNKRQLQIYTSDELSRKRDCFIRDLYILENQVLFYNNLDMILNINRNLLFETEIYSVSDNTKNLIRNVAELALAAALMKRNKKTSEAVKYQIACCNILVNQLFWGFYYKSIRYEVVDYEETGTENLKTFSYYYETLRKNSDLNPLKELIELNKEIIPYNSTSSQLYTDAVIERFADELCKENTNENEILKFTHPFKWFDGSPFEVDIYYSVHKNAGFIGIEDCKFNEENQ